MIKAEIPDYLSDDEHIVRRLGWAIVKQWQQLPKEAAELIIRQANVVEDRYQTVQLNEQIRAFIEKHTSGAQ